MGDTPEHNMSSAARRAPSKTRDGGYVAALQDAPGSRAAFLAYLAQQLQPYIGQRVLHINAGAGGLCEQLLPRKHYVACASEEQHAAELERTLGGQHKVHTAVARPPFAEHLPRHPDGFDTILWAREASFGKLDQLALRHLRTALAPHGRILLLVTGAKRPFVALDAVAADAKLQLRQLRQFDRLGTPVATAQRLMARVGLASSVQVLGDALRPLASKWDAVWPFAGRHALAVLVHQPILSEAECVPDAQGGVQLRQHRTLS